MTKGLLRNHLDPTEERDEEGALFQTFPWLQILMRPHSLARLQHPILDHLIKSAIDGASQISDIKLSAIILRNEGKNNQAIYAPWDPWRPEAGVFYKYQS